MSVTFFFIFFINKVIHLTILKISLKIAHKSKIIPTRWSEESYCNSALGRFKVQYEKDLTVSFEIDDIEVQLL